jgi:23S rRNA pseudouridine1911/1915/1917 synthase
LLLTDNVRERRFDVDNNFDGWRLDKFLANRLGRISRSRAGKIARHGDVEIVPPRKVKAGTRLRDGDLVILREHLPPERVQYDEVEILHRDDRVLVLNKPAGMLVHETPTVRLNTIQLFLQQRQGFEGAEPVHRIDRETSGVLVCAATPSLVTPLRSVFATTHPEKVYRALVDDPEGQWQPGHEKTIEIPLRLAEETRLGLRMVEGELDATTHVEALRRVGRFADLRVVIETGRQHQIRAHLAMQGTPVAGDKLYTYDDAFFMALHDDPENPELRRQLPFDRHMLHAWQIAIEVPGADELKVEAPLPACWL